MQAEHGTRLNVVVVGDLLAGFPRGYANTRYMRLIATGLVQAGCHVHVLIPNWSDRCYEERPQVAGTIGGVRYEHLSGEVCGRFPLLKRQWLKLRSGFMLKRRLNQLYQAGLVDAVLYDPWHFMYTSLIAQFCKRVRVPLLVQFVEWPLAWRNPDDEATRQLRGRYEFALKVADAFVVISDYLRDRCAAADRAADRLRPCHVMPILLDNDVWRDIEPARADSPYVVYCGSLDAYLRDVLFIVEAFGTARIAGHDLLLVGAAKPETKQRIEQHARISGVADRLRIETTYLSDRELLSLYAGAEALLAPLSADDRSRARFPSKLADYLKSGRPVVTSSVGEVKRYLVDGETAFLAAPDDVQSFAEKLAEAVLSEKRAAVSGAGKQLAETSFCANANGKKLRTFINAVVRRPGIADVRRRQVSNG